MNMRLGMVLAVGLVGLKAALSAQPENLLRNGSFEGGLLYWHGVDPANHKLVRGDAPAGEYALHLAKGYVMSAPFVVVKGERYTVSFFVKGDKTGEVHVQMPPSAREDGQRAKRLWTREATQMAKVTTEWQRVSFTWPADVPQSGFWPNPHYMVLIGTQGSTALTVDGVTVTRGNQGAPTYAPRREIEIVADCPDLPGYEGAKANVFERGATVRMTAHASNPGTEDREITLRWQLFDYEGERVIGEPVDKKVTILAGKTVSETARLPLAAVGCVIARVSVLDAQLAAIDSSDFPLTSLPYPKSATKPDWRERFGGSFAGGIGCVQKFQRIGFGWIRWRPHMNGEDHLPNAPKPGEPWQWRWFDQELDEQEAHGCSTHCVLYPPPKWIMEKGNPLPTDMRWKADDPRWDDLNLETTWDKFVKGAVTHYRGRSLIYEIENEPEFDRWDNLKDEYARFTIRTARLIKQTDPKARVMVDNVYGIPSGVNAALFKAGGLKHIDVMSWHDYHEGWLADASAIRRMRQNIDEAGGRHVEIWFNEGWAFSNTLVDEPIACTRLTSAQSANAIVDCVAELTANGQDKTILFHTAYEKHGMSFWDYSGPGTMLWDWYNYPLPLVAAWNVLAHHIGVSETAGFVRPPGANFCIFQDQRNGRGVMIAYADRDAKTDVTVELPDFGAALIAEDMMGNPTPAARTLTLSKSGRPVYLYSPAKTSGSAFREKLEPLDRRHASFVSAGTAAPEWRLPPVWEGKAKDSAEGNPAMADGKPIWRLDQIWPPDPAKPENYRTLAWRNGWWVALKDDFGGQPKAEMKDSSIRLEFRASHGTPPAERICGLVFIAPQAGTFRVNGSIELKLWDGNNPVRFTVLHKTRQSATEIKSVKLTRNQRTAIEGVSVALAGGDELVLLPRIEGAFTGGDVTLRDLVISLGGDSEATTAGAAVIYKLPAAWEGRKKGSTDGNPITANGKPIWRIDRVYPDQHIFAANYSPVPWDGTRWHPEDHQQGGQPSVQVENGSANLSVSGPWKSLEFQKIAGLVFIAPEAGIYQVKAKANSKPWTGGAKIFRLAVLKKDTQRAAEVKTFELPRDGAMVPLELQVELTAGHELVFLPLMPDWNNATTIRIEALTVARGP